MKIVALNSGGFDSVVLLHDLKNLYPDSEIHSLFFDYSQPNFEQESKCAENVAKLLGIKHTVISLPQFNWSKSDMLNPVNAHKYVKEENQYVEYRNLIFLSYALSYAQSIGAKFIFTAILKSELGYADTQPQFINNFNKLSIESCGIKVVAPYQDKNKFDLATIAFELGVEPNSFFSCNTPDENGKPCGKCGDCQAIEIVNKFLTVDDTYRYYLKTGNTFNDSKFVEMFKKSHIGEVRLLINNDCQLKCKHCFYGFDNMISPLMSLEEYKRVITEAVEIGVHNFHFSGKEPLFDEKIFKIAEIIKEVSSDATFDVVTNGINVPKYAKKLKDLGFRKVFLSVDDLLDLRGVRRVVNVTPKAIDALNAEGIPVEVFIDLHENNYDKVDLIINRLYNNFGVKSFYVRTIIRVGNAENFKLLTVPMLDKVLDCLMKVPEDIKVVFNVCKEYTDIIKNYQEDSLIKEVYDYSRKTSIFNLTENMLISFEHFCNSYGDNVTITPDGYVLGCAIEVSVPSYYSYSVGNVRDDKLLNLIKKGKDKQISKHQKLIEQGIKVNKCMTFYS